MKRMLAVACTLILLMLVGQCALAQIPRTLSYQGVLTDSTDHPKPDGDYALTFRLYEAASGGSALWTEAKTLPVKHGVFSTQLGDQVAFPAAATFDKPYWLSIQVSGGSELAPRLPLSSVAYSMTSVKADSTRIAGTVVNNSITTTKIADAAVTGAKITDGTIQCADLAQNGATEGQVLKWSSGSWMAAADATGGGGTGGGGWTDDGAVVGLTMPSDTVSLNTTARLGKLNLNGDIGLNGESGLYFGTRNSYLEATPGENLTLRANNDLKTYAAGGLTLLAADNINLGHLGEASWMKLDNTTKRVGIGMGTTDAIDDRLHVKQDLATNSWVRIESAHPSSWGQAGLRIKTPQNTWHLRMDASGNANFPDGALSLYNSGGGAFETMTWLKDGKVGIGTKNPIRKLHVNGSVEVEDTLYAGTINAGTIVNGPGVVHVRRTTMTLGDSYAPIDSLTINAPGSGYILLFFSGTLYSDHTFADRTYVRMSITSGRDGSGNLGKVEWQVDIKIPSSYCHTPMAVQGVTQVPSKGSYEFFAGGHRAVDGIYTPDRVTAQNIAFTALFIPAAFGTVETAPDNPPPSEGMARTYEPPKMDNSLESEVMALKLELKALKDATHTPASFEPRLNALTAELEALKRERASHGQ